MAQASSLGGGSAGGRSASLFIQPQGMTVTGITSWAARVASGLAREGRVAGILVHGGLAGHGDVRPEIDPRVRVFDRSDIGGIEGLAGDVSRVAGAYREAVAELARASGGAVCVVPTRHGDCFGACAEVTRMEPEITRVVGWQHVASAYEDAVIGRYEACFSGLVGVSAHIAGRLRARFPERAGDVAHVPNAVAVGELPEREPAAGRALRIVYTGRIEHEQKRVRALVLMSDALSARGVAHELVLVGDGPAMGEMVRTCAGRPAVRLVGAARAEEVARWLLWADVFALASRTEGLSVSLLEAMAAGCVPVITRTESGAAEVVDETCGRLVEFGDVDDAGLGERMAAAVEGVRGELAALAAGAHARACERFDEREQVRRTAALFDRVAAGPGRVWPSGVAAAFSGSGDGGASGSVPAGAADRLRAVLGALAGRRVVLHGAGQHTVELERVIRGVTAAGGAEVVAVSDDEPTRWGGRVCGWAIIEPGAAAGVGATDVVISSWMHEEAVWARRGVYESQGLGVHRVYGGGE